MPVDVHADQLLALAAGRAAWAAPRPELERSIESARVEDLHGVPVTTTRGVVCPADGEQAAVPIEHARHAGGHAHDERGQPMDALRVIWAVSGRVAEKWSGDDFLQKKSAL